ncbi:MAG: DUF374 domain-containing protein [Silvanigrellaceae bacterium]|nr:DUF374 domain-containing protein [Silvanigrellaceae bacterium]
MFKNLIFWILYSYYLLLLKTVKIKKIGFEEIEKEIADKKNPVLTSPHNSLLVAVLAYDGSPAVFLASLSKDGELISRILEKRKYKMVRGSSSRNAVQALNQMVSFTQKGHVVGLTFDGPRGPAFVPKKGIALLAKQATGSLYLCYAIALPGMIFGVPKPVTLNTWDKFLLPLPFGRFLFIAEKIETKFSDFPLENFKKNDDDFLMKIEKKCKEIYKKNTSHYFDKNKPLKPIFK